MSYLKWKRLCKTCGVRYAEVDNMGVHACKFHCGPLNRYGPGKWWPEGCWDCCGKSPYATLPSGSRNPRFSAKFLHGCTGMDHSALQTSFTPTDDIPEKVWPRELCEALNDDIMSLKRGDINIKHKDDNKSLYAFCRKMRLLRKHPGKSTAALTDERIASLDALGFDWSNSGIKSFEQRIEDLRAYKEKHGHVNVKEREDKSLYTFCKHTRYARNNPGKSGVVAITDDRIAGLDELGFDWSVGTRKKGAKKSFERLERQLEDSVEL